MKKQSLSYWLPRWAAAAADQLHGPVAEAVDFVAPLRFERRRADDQHLPDVGLAGQELRDADALDGLAQAHVVGQHRPAGAGGEGDAVELIGQERNLEQGRPQRMLGRVAANGGRLFAQPLLEEPLLDELLGIGIDRHVLAELLQLRQPLEQIVQVLDGPVLPAA